MAGHAGDVVATNKQVHMCLRAVLRQIGATGVAKNYNSLSEALHEMGLWDFVYNQAEVAAQYQAFSVRDNAIINKMTMAGAFANQPEGDA